MSPAARSPAVFGAVAALVVTAVSLGVAELVLRAADYPPAAFSPWIRSDAFGFRLAPGIRLRMRGPEYDVEVATNSLGLRDDEPAAKQGPRVLLLGDSFAMGYGVDRGDLFADRLEKELGADVVNAGTGGYEIVHQPRVLAELGPKLQPDLVLYALYLGNDLAQNDEWEERPDGTLRSLVREYPVRQKSEWKLYRLVRDAVYGMRKGRSEKEGEWLPFEGYLGLCERTLGEEAASDYAEADALLGRLAEEAARQKLPLFVVLLPYRSMVDPEAKASLAARIPDLDARYDLTRPAREMDDRLSARKIDHADVTPFLRELAGEGQDLFFPIDGHLTATGNEAVARFVAPLIRDRLPARAVQAGSDGGPAARHL